MEPAVSLDPGGPKTFMIYSEIKQGTLPGSISLKIRPVKYIELPLLQNLAPSEWNTDVSRLFASYFGQPYFHPIVAVHTGQVVGCANGLLHQGTGWLGNIIVLPEYRHQGIGSALTAYLVEYFHIHGCFSRFW
jgi:GNAT superfamily N-acetyltransferase